MGSVFRYSGVKIIAAAAACSAAFFITLAVFGGLTAAEIVKLNPAGLSVESSGVWADDTSAWSLSDRDTGTAYAPAGAITRLLITLSAETEIKSLKVYGAAAYDLKAYENVSGSWKPVPGLDGVTLKNQQNAWNSFSPAAAIRVKQLMLELTPSGGNAGGIKEIEIWGTGAGDPHITLAGTKTASDAKAVLAVSPRPAHISELAAAPAQVDVPADGNSRTITFSLPTDPRLAKRAYLVFDTYNADYLINPEKRINSGSWTGGFTVTSDTPQWSSHLEEINPSWLVRGGNTIEFRNLIQGRDPSSYFVRDLKVIVELENGWNVVSSLEGTSSDPGRGPSAAYDNDVNTWFELTSTNTLDIKAERILQPETIKLNLWSATGVLAGKLTLQYLQGSQWRNFTPGGTIDLATLHDGWNDIPLPEKVTADSIRMAFEIAPDRKRENATVGGVAEARLVGSPVGNRLARGLVLTFPLAGEFFGRTAFLQGFIDPVNNGSGSLQTAIEGKAATKPDGAIALPLSKDDTRFAAQADGDPWEAVVTASYPDGSSISRTVNLTRNLLDNSPTDTKDSSQTPNAPREKYTDKVSPGQAKKIQYKGVTLDIPEGAVDVETEITIIPLTIADLNKLNPGMIDVTWPDAGYRFLPHGMKFKKPIKISFGYSKTLFAAGQVDDEVNMYYYDEGLRRWQKLSRVKVDSALSQVTSLTDHFTDIINSTIVVPEHPQALTFNPNSIKDIKAADPSANVDLIEPPRANSKGTADLSYPIEIPKGRGAYTPDLRITYSSTNANGWMGLGWDIPIPSIQVDTRWGVPFYDAEKETESYLLSGQALAPVFKLFDDPATPRQPNRRFYKRVEGDFLKIIRMGVGPVDYSWEVTDKSGVRYYYGTKPETRLADYATGNIFQWFLEKVVDTNGNVTEFTYYTDTKAKYLDGIGDPAEPPQNALGGENWGHVYPERIVYTRNEKTGASAQYSIEFIRDAGNRGDLIINGKSGFKTAMRYRLARVDVKFINTLIRSYEMSYTEGDFSKSLIDRIAVKDENGTEFYGHGFDYYRMDRLPGGIYNGFSGPQIWLSPNDFYEDRTDFHFMKDILNKTVDRSHTRNRYDGFSWVPSRAGSRGTLSGYTNAESEAITKFVDVNGDGLPDFLHKNQVNLNLGGPEGTNAFGLLSPMQNFLWPEKENRWTISTGHAKYYYKASFSNDFAYTLSSSIATTSDMNGDGFVDYVTPFGINLNNYYDQGKMTFSTNWSFVTINDSGIETFRKHNFYLIDPVRKWSAPFAGDVRISGTIQRKKREEAQQTENKEGDGVTIYIYRENSEIGRLLLAPEDYTVHPIGDAGGNAGSDAIDLSGIQPGERIYFRLDSVDNGENDEIIFDPQIIYTASGTRTQEELQTLMDSMGHLMYRYRGSDDFTMADTKDVLWGSPYKGTLALTGRIDKQPTISDVQVEIKRGISQDPGEWNNVIAKYTLPAGGAESIDLSQTLSVEQGEQFIITVTSDRTVDPSRTKVTLDAVFTEVQQCRMSEDFFSYECTMVPVVDPDVVDDDGMLLFRHKPQVNYRIVPTVPKTSSLMWIAPYNGTIRITGDVIRSAVIPMSTASILGVNRVHWQQVISAEAQPEDGSALTYTHDVTMDVSQGEQLFFEVRSKDILNGAVSWAPKITYTLYCSGSCAPVICTADQNGNVTCIPAGRDFVFQPAVEYYSNDPAPDAEPFGGGWRQWYYGEWNGNEAWDQSKLVVNEPETENDQVQNYFRRPSPSDGGTLYSERQPIWTGGDDRCFISKTGLSSSRLLDSGGAFSRNGVFRVSSATNTSNGASMFYKGDQASQGSTDTQVELLDFNGDRYPDLIMPSGVLLNDGRTGFRMQGLSGPGTFRTNFNHNEGFSVGIGAIANAIKSTAQTMFQNVGTGSGGSGSGFNWWTLLIPSMTFNAGFVRGQSLGMRDLVDVNGDGLPDIVSSEITAAPMFPFTGGGVESALSVRLNLGSRFGDPERWSIPGSGPLRYEDNKTLSISFGADWLSGTISHAQGPGLSTVNRLSDFVDVNGDGLPDRISKSTSADNLMVSINRGGTFAPPQVWKLSSWLVGPIGDQELLRLFSFINNFPSVPGDEGVTQFLNELIVYNDSISNMTTETFSEGFVVNGKAASFIAPWKQPLWRIWGWENSTGGSIVRSQVEFTDIDGDGLPDHVYKSGLDEMIYVKRNLSGKANLLKTVKRPLGGSFTLDYARKGNKVDYTNPNNIIDMPQSWWVLSQVTLTDGMKKPDGSPKHVYTTSYSYGPGYYNRTEREFYGFNRVTETRGSGSDTVTVINDYHNQDYYQKGLLLSSITRSGGEEGNAWIAAANEYVVRPEADLESKFPHLKKTVTSWYNVQAKTVAKSTMQEYLSYDQYGNITEYVDRSDEGNTCDDVLASIRYQQSNPSEYIVDKPRSIEVRDCANRLHRSRSASYEPGTGNMIDLFMLVSPGRNAHWSMSYYPDGNLRTITAPPGDPAHNKKTDGYALAYEYDPETATHVTKITDSFGYVSEASYDYRFGLPAWQRDINGNYQVNVYDDFGRLALVYGPYDTNGPNAPAGIKPALELIYAGPALDEGGMISVPASATTKNKAAWAGGSDPDTVDTVTFADGLKRIIQTKKEADVARNSSTVDYGMVVSGTVVFDALGRVVEQDQPTFFAGLSYQYVPNLLRRNPTRFTYDTLDRTTSIRTPDGALTVTVYGFGVPPRKGGGTMFKTTVVDPNGNAYGSSDGRGMKISYKDSHDRIVEIKEYNTIDGQVKEINTDYAYNIMNEIVNVTDAGGNPTTIVYDLLGRRLSIDNKDTGNTIYTYDANGNITTKETANLRTGAKKINYIYEYNRLDTIDYPDSADVIYVYGGPSETGDQIGNLAGRIKSVTDESGLEERFYGRLGETTKEYKQVNASNNPIMRKRYETRYVFDSFGRMREMTYPDGETLYYGYDHGGLLKTAAGLKRGNGYDYITKLWYNEFGQRRYLTYGNKVATEYAYNPLNLRLAYLGTVDGTGTTIQSTTYDYDPVGNINWTKNAAPVPAGGQLGGPTDQRFVYDYLYQLTTAVGYHLPSPGKRTQYTNNLTYDTIGNITRKLQTHLIIGSSGSTQEPAATNYDLWYKYQGIHPHAVTDAGDKLYGYDLNGNMTGWVSKANPNVTRLIAWNEENRVKSIADSGSGTEFVYDDAGERVIKRGGGNEAVYLNRFYSLKNGDLGSKHIFAGETRICTKIEKDGGSIQTGVPGTQGQALTIGNIQFANTRGNADIKRGIERRLQGAIGAAASPPIEKFEFFYHGDHLGSSSFITDDAGAVYQHLEYFPYGETWVEDGGSGQMPYYRFTGKELDPETGLYYYGARYYDPVISRWISADPILGIYLDGKPNAGIYDSSNIWLYSYTSNNPIIYRDSDGNFRIREDWTLDVSWAANDLNNQAYQSMVGAWNEGNYGQAAVGAILYAANQGNMAAAYVAQGALVPVNAPLKYAHGMATGNYEEAQIAGCELLASATALKMALPSEAPKVAVATTAVSIASTSTVARSLKNPSSLKGASVEEVNNLIPKNWTANPTKGAGGTRYANPARPGEQVRVMPGNLKDPNPLKQGPYVRVSQGGVKSEPIPLKGNPTLNE